jgi:hypothetical protein
LRSGLRVESLDDSIEFRQLSRNAVTSGLQGFTNLEV